MTKERKDEERIRIKMRSDKDGKNGLNDDR